MKGTLESFADRIAEILKAEAGRHAGQAAIAYSGGLDSSILMAASGFSLAAFTVGFTDSKDIQNARSASSTLQFPLHIINLTEEDVLEYRHLVEEIDPDITRVELGYEIVLAAVLDNIKETALVTGQGADELFYGYRRFLDDPLLNNDSHLKKLFGVTLPRETKISDYYGKTLITPFLDPGIIRIAEEAGRDSNIRGGTNKAVLRDVASILGLPPEVAGIPKKAAQYGSGVSKALSKMQ